MKSQEEWKAQQDRLIWKLSAKEGLTFDEAGTRIMERAIRFGATPSSRKFWRIIQKMMLRRGLPFAEAATKVWDRAVLLLIRRGFRDLKTKLGEDGG